MSGLGVVLVIKRLDGDGRASEKAQLTRAEVPRRRCTCTCSPCSSQNMSQAENGFLLTHSPTRPLQVLLLPACQPGSRVCTKVGNEGLVRPFISINMAEVPSPFRASTSRSLSSTQSGNVPSRLFQGRRLDRWTLFQIGRGPLHYSAARTVAVSLK